MGNAEVKAFLIHLAVELEVSPSTQKQALAALLFLYRELLAIDLDLERVVRAVRRLHRADLAAGFVQVALPHALAR